jgi:hypothetical protein
MSACTAAEFKSALRQVRPLVPYANAVRFDAIVDQGVPLVPGISHANAVVRAYVSVKLAARVHRIVGKNAPVAVQRAKAIELAADPKTQLAMKRDIAGLRLLVDPADVSSKAALLAAHNQLNPRSASTIASTVAVAGMPCPDKTRRCRVSGVNESLCVDKRRQCGSKIVAGVKNRMRPLVPLVRAFEFLQQTDTALITGQMIGNGDRFGVVGLNALIMTYFRKRALAKVGARASNTEKRAALQALLEKMKDSPIRLRNEYALCYLSESDPEIKKYNKGRVCDEHETVKEAKKLGVKVPKMELRPARKR